MKWCVISKDAVSLLVVNRMRDNAKVCEREDFLKMIHKKNPNKGKLSSIKMKGPYKMNDIHKWVIYYEAPLKKKHTETEWELCCPDEKIKVFNGAILIHTRATASTEYPIISNTEDVTESSASEWKSRELDNVDEEEDIIDNDDFDDDGDEDGDEDEEQETQQTKPRVKFDDVGEEEEDEDEDVEEEDDELVLSEAVAQKNSTVLELEDDLDTNKSSNLVYEEYDYDSELIPSCISK